MPQPKSARLTIHARQAPPLAAIHAAELRLRLDGEHPPTWPKITTVLSESIAWALFWGLVDPENRTEALDAVRAAIDVEVGRLVKNVGRLEVEAAAGAMRQ